ncbi:hypothetical protein OB905_11565 [Halobacteria archaeon AArc-dxtr1]|nr:hypothetical protein [Halobacteria archaeon AArc-dxtr1]
MEGADNALVVDLQTTDLKPSVAIVDAIATLEGVELETLSETHDIRVYDWVDPDALDTLLASGDGVSVQFPIGEYRVDSTDAELRIQRR